MGGFAWLGGRMPRRRVWSCQRHAASNRSAVSQPATTGRPTVRKTPKKQGPQCSPFPFTQTPRHPNGGGAGGNRGQPKRRTLWQPSQHRESYGTVSEAGEPSQRCSREGLLRTARGPLRESHRDFRRVRCALTSQQFAKSHLLRISGIKSSSKSILHDTGGRSPTQFPGRRFGIVTPVAIPY